MQGPNHAGTHTHTAVFDLAVSYTASINSDRRDTDLALRSWVGLSPCACCAHIVGRPHVPRCHRVMKRPSQQTMSIRSTGPSVQTFSTLWKAVTVRAFGT